MMVFVVDFISGYVFPYSLFLELAFFFKWLVSSAFEVLAYLLSQMSSLRASLSEAIELEAVASC